MIYRYLPLVSCYSHGPHCVSKYCRALRCVLLTLHYRHVLSSPSNGFVHCIVPVVAAGSFPPSQSLLMPSVPSLVGTLLRLLLTYEGANFLLGVNEIMTMVDVSHDKLVRVCKKKTCLCMSCNWMNSMLRQLIFFLFFLRTQIFRIATS